MPGCPYASMAAMRATVGTTEASGQSRGGEAESSAEPRTASALETLTNELVASLRPTEMSEARRRAVFEHIKQLAQECFGTAHTLVSAYGSVPLRAYLPDGDIDVCLLGDHRVIDKATWTTKFRKYIEKAEAEADPPHEFAVSEVSVINAEVKLMKCIVDGMMVDVSANQFGGLASLGFLEETNTFIGRDDLFVRSIILVKAWGFYEGRILGAHHALISTYALETLVLYIINKYHAELTCPLSVLHKLLDVFAEFEWEKYALTIHGPVAIEDIETPPMFMEDGLLTQEFTQTMLSTYSCEFMRSTAGATTVPIKYMNIIDPLVSSNNLGRSVSCGNYMRIRAALRLGAQRLDKLMASSAACDDMGVLRGFVSVFGNILRHRRMIYPLPHAPDTPGGCSHADEVSLTPLGMPTSAIASRSRSVLLEGSTPATAAEHPHTRSVVDELRPIPLKLDEEDVEQDDVGSPTRTLRRSESSKSVNEEQRGIHWGRWDLLVDEQANNTTPEGEEHQRRKSLDDDSAKMSSSPPQSVSSDDATELADSADKVSPPVPDDAIEPGINDIFTGCLDTIREHLMFGVYHHRRAHERREAARHNVEERKRGGGANNNRKGNRALYNRSKNASRQGGKGNKNFSQQQGFQPQPPPGAPPPGTAKRGYASDNNGHEPVFVDMQAHFPHVAPHCQAPQRPRSPRPSPTFPQAWSGVAKIPANFMSEPKEKAAEQSPPVVTMAAVLKRDIEELSIEPATTQLEPVPEVTPPPVSAPVAKTPSWGPKGSAPIDVLKANACKPVVDERPKTPSITEENAPIVGEESSLPPEHCPSDDSANATDTAQRVTTKTRRVRSRKGKPRAPTVECEDTFPSLATSSGSSASPFDHQHEQQQPSSTSSKSQATTSWAKLL